MFYDRFGSCFKTYLIQNYFRMAILRKVEWRLYPAKSQADELARISDTCRKVYNWALDERRKYYEEHKKTLTFNAQCKALTQSRKAEFAWQYVHTHALQVTLKRLDLAFKQFFRRLKNGEDPGFPRFKSVDRFSGFGFKEYGNGWSMEKRAVKLSGVGRIKLRGKSRFTDGTPKTCEIIRRADKWFLSVTYTLAQLPVREKTAEHISGLDWGVTTFATITNADGSEEEIQNPRHLRKQLGNLADAQRKLKLKKKGSKRRYKAKHKVAVLHRKIANQRKNFLHQTTSHLVATRAKLAVEILSTKAMTAEGGKAKSGLNREILASSPGAFHSMLAYKAEEAGCAIIEVDPLIHRPSQTCSGGGKTRKKALSERSHVLPDGSIIGRDFNSSRNLLHFALGREPTTHPRPDSPPDTACETSPIAA
jgi:putative transposase